METVKPLDVLNRAKGNEVLVELKNGTKYMGSLKSFDIHLNIVLFNSVEIVDENKKEVGDILIRGDTIIVVKNI